MRGNGERVGCLDNFKQVEHILLEKEHPTLL